MTYAMFQRWENLLFAHWRVEPSAVASKIPAGLALDLWQGSAWIAVTPFEISRLRLRGLPPIPGTSRFPELNVRTYVTAGGKPGVWFFSLDAGSSMAVFFARRLYHLPYFSARMACVKRGNAISYRCARDDPSGRAEFLADYEPIGDPFQTEPGSLEEWLTARYCLYAEEGGTLYRAEIDHAPWALRRARAKIVRNTMAAASGIDLPREQPLLHYAAPLEVRVWWPERVDPRRRSRHQAASFRPRMAGRKVDDRAARGSPRTRPGRPRDLNPTASRTVVYDGDCRVCSRLAVKLARWDRRGRLEIVPSKSPGVAARFPWISAEAYGRSLQVVGPGRRTLEGAVALHEIFSLLPRGRLFAGLLQFPLLRRVADRFYRWFARNRYRFGCGKHCAARPE